MSRPQTNQQSKEDWISWVEIRHLVGQKKWLKKYPNTETTDLPTFERLFFIAQDYFEKSGRHLHIYGDIGELFAALTLGIKLHRNNAEGSDGRVGKDFVEVKTITPLSSTNCVLVKSAGNFSKLLVVKINKDFEIACKLIDRKKLKSKAGKYFRVNWNTI